MLDLIQEIWSYIQLIVNEGCSFMDDLVTNLDNVQFTQQNVFSLALGTIRYIVGDTLYLLFFTLTSITMSLTAWKLLKTIVNAVSSVIPGLKGKIKIE